MGIPKFFRYISERYPCLSESLKDYQIPEFDNVYLDMNGIIHGCSHPNDSDVTFRITEETIFKNIFQYIEILFNMIRPQKLFFMAIDGVAPRAKINQQRCRRFRAAKNMESQEANAKVKGINVPNEKRFDSNCITPGTLFMYKLDKQLKYFITYKISNDKLWQKCKVIFSGSQVAGEGEHKIMDYIRYMKSQPDYDPHTRHCLYGLDADLIMLGLCTHELYFTLLREEVKFGKAQMKIITPEETKFCLFHLSLLREYITHEFSSLKEKLPFSFDIEKLIDDWILMGFLIGNDFIPHLANLHISNGTLPVLYQVYIDVLPTLDGYINESGTLKLDRFEKFMERLSRFDLLTFSDHWANLKYFESKTGRRLTESDKTDCKKLEDNKEILFSKSAEDKEFDALLRSAADMSPDSDENEEEDELERETYNMEFVRHKKDYYMNKLEHENIDEDFLRSLCEGYVKAIQWNLNYYYNGCCSWSWYYPRHYAPYISDIKGFKDLKLEFDLGEPFLPFQQLLAVLPPYSKDLLPKAFQTLLTEEDSPIINYYPADFKTDLNGKRQEWEGVVLIPFIDEKDLLDAMEPCYSQLNPKELKRNRHGPMCLLSYTEENMGICKESKYFPDAVSHVNVQFINREDIIVPREKLVRGLSPGAKMDEYCPGFPMLRFIEHTAKLEKSKVKVFDRGSINSSMILYIKPPPKTDLTSVASELLGKIVFVNWPRLMEAQVVGVSNCDKKLSLIHPQMNYCNENINEEELKGLLGLEWNMQKKHIIETYKVSLGIEVGETNILIHARPMVGSKYICNNRGEVRFEKQWSESQIAYAYQVIVKNIPVFSHHSLSYKNVDDIFVPGSICFMLGHPHYGGMGKVVESAICKKSARIRISVAVTPEPSLEAIKQLQQQHKTQYMRGSIAAQRLGISAHLLSRITGSIYVKQTSDEFHLEEAKYNIGLNLKFNKKNEEVPGYTRKENGQWLYSSKAVDLIRNYMVKCPELFERLTQIVSNDVFMEDNLFDKGSGTLNDIVAWLKEELQGLKSCPCDTEALEPNLMKKLEEELDEFLSAQSNNVKHIPMLVKPHLLFKPGLNMRNTPPDPKTQTYFLDRVCCIRDNFMVPLGFKGTVIGIHKAENPLDTMYDILFDKQFPGGLSINGCTDLRAYRLSPIDLINISHGERIEHAMETWKHASNQEAQSCAANASAFASYKKKNYSSAEPLTSPKLRIIQRNNEESNQSCRLAPPPNAYRWKQCNMQNTVANVRETHKPTKSAQQNAPLENTPEKPSTSKPSFEFQALWNELHKSQKPNGSPKAAVQVPTGSQVKQINKGFPESSPQDPSAFLKAVLKISNENIEQSTQSVTPKTPSNNTTPKEDETLDTPPLVQQLFDHARQNEKVKDEKKLVWYCSQLMYYYKLSGVGVPRFSYFTDEKTNLIRAHILLPDKRVFVGDPSSNHSRAAGSAAEKVYTELNLANVLPNMKTLLLPPVHWYSGRQNNSWPPNVRPPGVLFQSAKPQPHQHYHHYTPVKVQHNPGYQQVHNQNNQYKLHSSQNVSKSEIKHSTSFVPLQAQKNSRNITAKQDGTKGTNQSKKDYLQPVSQQKKKNELPTKKQETVATTIEKQKSTQCSSRQTPNTQDVIAKPKKSRVAAKFNIPSQVEETNHNSKRRQH
ncbi:5'-3' exoribonuclease pacman [Colletes latitarsis]|uniref:5'-3' exoribonuclease pacman n=1 Tax=Colletes latitarsis TaxID=2605962 RepID=UPI00403538E0